MNSDNKKLRPLSRRVATAHLFAGFLTYGTLLFAFPAIKSKWHYEEYTPDYSGGTIPVFHWIPFSNK